MNFQTMESINRRELEIVVLRKYDRNALEIIESAPFVAAYTFNSEQSKWEKLKCEGILFLYRKVYEPQYNLFLLNRLSNLHLYQPVGPNLKLQVEDSYLLFRNDDGVIFGLWIYDKQVFAKISEEIKKIIYNINLKTFCKIPLETDNDENVCRLLRKSEEEYLKSFFGLKHFQNDKVNDNASSTPESVAKFFEEAGKVFKTVKNTTKIPFFKDSSEDNILKNLICNANYNVESIEKNQRCSYVTNN